MDHHICTESLDPSPASRPALELKRVAERSLIPRPAWLANFERALGRRIPLHPHVLSAAKLAIVTPALLLCLAQGQALFGVASVVLFVVFGGLDYLDGVTARERNLASEFGRIFDRVTDYPLLFGVSLCCKDVLPWSLLVVKLTLDGALLVLFLLGRGGTQNRLRTAMSYTTLLALMLLSQGWLGPWVTAHTVVGLVLINAAFTGVVVLFNVGVLRKRHVANLLSFGNLCAGAGAIVFASRGAVFASLLLLLLGLAFDGFDGVAARRWGSSRWGVLADDVADGVNFALAPAAVLAFTLGNTVGILLGVLYATCTIARLVYFTLAKDAADPRYFSGVPSPVGGLLVICAALLFDNPAVVGMFVGLACAQMTSFSTAYRHLGRVVAARPRLLLGVPWVLGGLGAALWAVGPAGPAALLLGGAVCYTLWPAARSFGGALRQLAPT